MKQIYLRKRAYLPGDRMIPDGQTRFKKMQKKIHRLESKLREQESEISAMRQILITHPVREFWEVPG